MNRVVCFVLASVVLSAVPPALYACTCGEVKRSTEEAQAAFRGWFRSFEGALFVGKVTKIEKVQLDLAGRKTTELKVTFSIERFWKGVRGSVVAIYTGAGCCDCGVRYTPGERYFVLAQKIQGRLRTDICTSPKDLSEVASYEKEFRKGSVPAKQQ